jgi:hypothetical protein
MLYYSVYLLYWYNSTKNLTRRSGWTRTQLAAAQTASAQRERERERERLRLQSEFARLQVSDFVLLY